MHPALRIKYEEFQKRAEAAGIDFIVTCTYRSDAEQAQLYAQGRTKPGKKVTNAPPGKSPHNCTIGPENKPAAKGFDICIMKHGKPDWNAEAPEWAQLGIIGVQCGLSWAGLWKNFREMPHFELPNWKKG
jgi:peptidoglycan L-alanyl-D-glutamate endopeptidase CwlK